MDFSMKGEGGSRVPLRNLYVGFKCKRKKWGKKWMEISAFKG